MVDIRSGPVIEKVQVGAMIQNKHMDHMKPENLQQCSSKTSPAPQELEPIGSPSLSSIEETLESEMDTVDVTISTPLPSEEENEFPWAQVQAMIATDSINFRKWSGGQASACINGAEVEVVKSFKFLGVNITNNLSGPSTSTYENIMAFR
eukprot:g46126.t1